MQLGPVGCRKPVGVLIALLFCCWQFSAIARVSDRVTLLTIMLTSQYALAVPVSLYCSSGAVNETVAFSSSASLQGPTSSGADFWAAELQWQREELAKTFTVSVSKNCGLMFPVCLLVTSGSRWAGCVSAIRDAAITPACSELAVAVNSARASAERQPSITTVQCLPR